MEITKFSEVEKLINDKDKFAIYLKNYLSNNDISIDEGDAWYTIDYTLVSVEEDQIKITSEFSQKYYDGDWEEHWTDEYEDDPWDNEEYLNIETFRQFLLNRKFGNDESLSSFKESLSNELLNVINTVESGY